MRVKLKAFPAVYFYMTCAEHNCKINVRVEGSKDFGSINVIGGQITTLSCDTGGPVDSATCLGSWEMVISATGDVAVIH